MHAARGVHLRVRGHVPFERRQLGIVGGVVSGLLNPILGGTTTTTTRGQPVQTTTTVAPNPGTTTPAGNVANPGNGGGPAVSTANPGNGGSPAGSTANLGNGSSGGSAASPNPGTGSGNRGDVAASSKVAGTSTVTGTASNPSRSSVSADGNGTSGNTSSGGTTSNMGYANGNSSGSNAESNSDARGGSSGSSKEGASYSTSDSGSGTSGNGDPNNPSPSDVHTLGDSNGNKSHAGAIAAAVILAILFVVAVVVFVLRRRSKARRDYQADRWWFTRKRTSQTYGDDEVLHAGNSSRRSSFATNVDHANTSFLAKAAIPPPPPPMAEVGRPKGTAPTLVLNIDPEQNRFSIGSATSSHDSQFLIVCHRESLLHEAMSSARTESFPFPKPPIADRASLHSKNSRRSLPDLKQDGDVFGTSPPSPSQSTQRPLADPFADSNPFEDPSRTPSPVLSQNVIGTVRRPFTPQLQDELRVDLGDSVRILQSFDDGWALAEKMDTSNGGPSGGQGFIPLECFLELELGHSSPGKTRRSSHSTEGV